MNILITGANGYIGQRLIPAFLEEHDHRIYCTVRNKRRFEKEHTNERIDIIELDLLNPQPTDQLPKQIDVAYYLIHSMTNEKSFEDKELASAKRFLSLLANTNCKQIIYLTGIVNEKKLSKHLESRFAVEKTLSSGSIPLTALRAGIIVGSGSASFEIIRDLVEKLPLMVAPKWLNTLCQPIAIRNVIQYLKEVALQEKYFDNNFDIGGTEILSYKQMLLQFAEVRKLKRRIFIVPVMTPKLSSYWLYFITSTSYRLAANLVDSMKVNVICRKNSLAKELDIHLLSYKEAVSLAFEKIEQHMVLSSWKDAFISSNTRLDLLNYVDVPVHGCFKDIKWREVQDRDKVIDNIWSIGGQKGWYYGNHLWKLRGLMDKFAGGVGLRRGRTNSNSIEAGDALDFWRVLIADKANSRLLLFAEMKLPGEAWLEFRIMKKHNKIQLRQTATFRPRGLWGRLYWYMVLPFHYFIFNGMINNITKVK
ncbi:MAG: SDR family oxidoreductase [Chitinophagaceae bacterium]|nr:MAG: SDR family oxidoreductase [Chitinophagaceae bacterium]